MIPTAKLISRSWVFARMVLPFRALLFGLSAIRRRFCPPDIRHRCLAILAGAGKQAPRLDARKGGRALPDQDFFGHSLSPPFAVLCINIAPFPLPTSQLVSSNRSALEWGRDTDCSFPASVLYDLFFSSRSVIFLRPMPSVDPLCSNAEVVGGSTPATPSAIRVRLKPTMKR